MRHTLPLLILSGCIQLQPNPDRLRPACPRSCYVVDGRIVTDAGLPPLLGACRYGVPICDDDGRVTECADFQYAQVERCDGIDNDCDGMVDAYVWRGAYPDGEYPCKYQGMCRSSEAICQNGEWICWYEQDVELPSETSCDNKDNDCDGLIDEGLSGGEFCFDHPDWWRATGDSHCKAGARMCVDGTYRCIGQVLPSPETCDGIDNDCDGFTDDVDNGHQFDVVYLIDTSGSMCGGIAAVINAVSLFAAAFVDNSNYRFGIVDVAARYRDPVYGQVRVIQPLGSFTDFQAALSQVGCQGTGAESTLDGPWHVLNGTLDVGRNQDAALAMLMFTDESPQSYGDPMIDVYDLRDRLQELGGSLYVWGSDSVEWSVPSTGYFPLTADGQQMANDAEIVNETMCIDYIQT